MGSNVFKLPSTGIFSNTARQACTDGGNGNGQPLLLPALAVPSFRRRPTSVRKQATSTDLHWAVSARRRAALRLVEPSHSGLELADKPRTPSSPPPTLRVLRLVEAGQAPGTAGRLRLSGRLEDVCAELDRMAAAEAASAGSRALRA